MNDSGKGPSIRSCRALRSRRIRLLAAALAGTCLTPLGAAAQTSNWIGTNGSYSDATNWSAGVPPSTGTSTGITLVEAVPRLAKAAGSPLQVRVGIATGLVVVGDLLGSGEAQERGIVGETPNLAARLQAIAEPNTVVIADSTRRLLGNLFELLDLGTWDIKGIAGPARVWNALRARSVESRFEALHAAA